jgi:IS30 family transposase
LKTFKNIVYKVFCNSKTNDFFAKGVITMARPKKKIDMNIVEQLASEGCTVAEIASHFGVHQSTLYRRKKFKEVYERGLEKCKLSVRRALYKKGVTNGDTKALIFLAKNLLDMSDNPQKDDGNTTEQVIRVILED